MPRINILGVMVRMYRKYWSINAMFKSGNLYKSGARRLKGVILDIK